MKKFFTTITNTYKAMRLFANPEVMNFIIRHMEIKGNEDNQKQHSVIIGKNNLYIHRHYMIQVLS